MSTAAVRRVHSTLLAKFGPWPLLLGVAALAVPTAISLTGQEWTSDAGAHEPFVLAVGAGLLWRRWSVAGAVAEPARWAPTTALLLVSLPAYVVGRAFGFLTFEAAGLYGVGIVLLLARFGARGLRALWFPVVFLAFAIPPPHALLDALTAPLKELVSYLATSGLAFFGLPVARQGVVIFVAQYQLLVEDACSGMNSIVGLTALGLLYAYLRHGSSLASSMFLACVAIPVAIAANVVRVALLVVITYIFGDAAGQGFMHLAAGLVLFSAALLLIFVIDSGLHWMLSLGRRA